MYHCFFCFLNGTNSFGLVTVTLKSCIIIYYNIIPTLFQYTDTSSLSKGCPPGSAQHLALIDNDCEINYCVKANIFSGQLLAPVHRPPFRHSPKMNYNITVPLTIINDDTAKVWMKGSNHKWIEATDGLVMLYFIHL